MVVRKKKPEKAPVWPYLCILVGVILIVGIAAYVATRPTVEEQEVEPEPTPVPEPFEMQVWEGEHTSPQVILFSVNERDRSYTDVWRGDNFYRMLDLVYSIPTENGPVSKIFARIPGRIKDGGIYKLTGTLTYVEDTVSPMMWEVVIYPKLGITPWDEIYRRETAYPEFYLFEGTDEVLEEIVEERVGPPLWTGEHYDRVITIDDDNLVQFEFGIENVESGLELTNFYVNETTLRAGEEYNMIGSIHFIYAFATEINEEIWNRRDLFSEYTYYSFFPDSIEEVA